ncbi:MAG TPA: ABC transporter permease, partial [Chromatiales bacterium]|nr:ABC transporter permease [Chromatiales bacterium]
MLAVAIGAGAVLMLSALGEGARRYVVREFAALGTNLLIVLPGRSETAGAAPGLFVGMTPRELTLEDALALLRSPHVRRVAPVVVGSAPVSRGAREREATVLGSTAELVRVRHWRLARGRNLPEGDPRRALAVCLLGATVARELFGADPPLGQWVRIGDRRFRVIGVLAPQGFALGVKVDEMVVVPVASAQALFDTSGLF